MSRQIVIERLYPDTLGKVSLASENLHQAPVAQGIEYCPPKAGVVGSNPARRAIPTFFEVDTRAKTCHATGSSMAGGNPFPKRIPMRL